jgi:chemotaxis protein methyltransferase CheR
MADGLQINEELVKKYAELVREWSGIYFSNSNIIVLERKILSRCKEKGYTPDEYFDLLSKDYEELISFLDSITTNFTKFFRHSEQFELIRLELIPKIALKRRVQGVDKIRLWSAGSATGEEPYSLLITALESIKENMLDFSVEVIASDISLRCIEIAQRGVYSPEKLEGIPGYIIEEYFRKLPDGKFEVKEEYKKYVRFDYHNLMYDNGLRNIDIVMCRNVLIYLDQESISKVIENIYRALRDDGYLFLSPAESLFGITDKFKPNKEKGVFFYTKA